MQNLAFLYENLPTEFKTKVNELLEFWAFQKHFLLSQQDSFPQILTLLPEKLKNDLTDYLAFLDTKIDKEIDPIQKKAKATLLAQKIVYYLEKMPAQEVENLKKELQKMTPQADSTVMLKIGSGIDQEDKETIVGIFIAIQSVQTSEEIVLETFFENVLFLAKPKQIELLEKVLDEFEQESEEHYWLTFMPFSKIEGSLWGGQFTIHGKLL